MIPDGTMIGNTYQIVREIGRGGTGVVYLAYHLNLQKYVVLKNTRLSGVDLGFLRNEVDLLKELHHPGLPQVYDFLTLGNEVYTVIDYVNGTDFEQLVDQGVSFTEDELTRYMLEVAQVLVYLHGRTPPILHSDIKPGNIMLKSDGSICLIDFNISVALNGGQPIYGLTRNYASPEQRQLSYDVSHGIPSDVTLDDRSDVYSLGATFYYLITGVEPSAQDNETIPVRSFSTGFSGEFLGIIEKAMAPDPEERYQTAASLAAALKKHLRRGADFRKKCLIQAVLVFLCGSLFIGGLCTFIFGQSRQRLERFEEKYEELGDSVHRGTVSESIDLGAEILKNYAGELEKNPKMYCYVELVMGDCYAEREELSEAEDHYGSAYEIARKNDLPLLEDCFLKYAQVLTERKDRDGLLGLKKDIDDDAQLMEFYPLLEARVFISENDLENGEQTLENLLEEQPGRDSCYEAYRLLAHIAELRQDYAQEELYLEQARQEKDTDEVKRALAQVYTEQANRSEAEARTARFGKAAEMYWMLCDKTDYPAFGDLVSGAESCRNAQMYAEAEQMVDRLLSMYPNSFHSYAQAALLRGATGEKDLAKTYAQKALALSENEEQVSQGLIERLQSLAS